MVSKQQRAHPGGIQIIVRQKNVLPKYVQYVQCSTRGFNTLDQVYFNIKHAYRTVPFPHLGLSNHLSLVFISAHATLRRKTKPQKLLQPVQTMRSLSYRTASLTQSGVSWNCRTSLTLSCLTSDSALMWSLWTTAQTSKVQSPLKACNSAFRSGLSQYSSARANLT